MSLPLFVRHGVDSLPFFTIVCSWVSELLSFSIPVHPGPGQPWSGSPHKQTQVERIRALQNLSHLCYILISVCLCLEQVFWLVFKRTHPMPCRLIETPEPEHKGTSWTNRLATQGRLQLRSVIKKYRVAPPMCWRSTQKSWPLNTFI